MKARGPHRIYVQNPLAFFVHIRPNSIFAVPALYASHALCFASPSGKIILNTKKKITMDTPPVMIVTRIL